MGIKHFFTWFKTNFSEYIYKLSKKTLDDIEVNVDNLVIDMNGIIHNSTQKVYEYGSYKKPERLLKVFTRAKRINTTQKNIEVFQDICESIENIFIIVKPKKRLILCIDGPAPLSKQNQQRQRRFRSAMESSISKDSFDRNSITPGTKFMGYLNKYIDWYIRERISHDEDWRNIEIIFSNDKVCGEGEHKGLNYIRYHGIPSETFCINGLDADLIMLALGTHLPNFYILREDLYDPSNDYLLINIGRVHKELSKMLQWHSDDYKYNETKSINDFVFLCFMVGNDFLPHIPSIEIIENGIELIVEIYKEVGTSYGHITREHKGIVKFNLKPMHAFLATIGQHEKENFEHKLSKKQSCFPDPLLESCSKQDSTGKWSVDIEKYKREYHSSCFAANYSAKKLCHEYLEGMQWVLSYYTRGVPSWEWCFKHHYAPHASLLSEYIKTFKFVSYDTTDPTPPFLQLLCVLPPKSASLLPNPLNKLLTDEDSPLKAHCPDDFEIDLRGKRKEWEGIVLLPIVDIDLVRKTYFEYIDHVLPNEIQRNIRGRTTKYSYSNLSSYTFKSYYGDIPFCKVKSIAFDL